VQASKTYVPKDGRLYSPIEAASHPRLPNILTSSDAGANGSDGRYWAAVRGAWMKCFTSTNLKRVSADTCGSGSRGKALVDGLSKCGVLCGCAGCMHITAAVVAKVKRDLKKKGSAKWNLPSSFE
jgi:hypothetical protein